MLKTASGEPKLNPVNGKVRAYLDRNGKESQKQY